MFTLERKISFAIYYPLTAIPFHVNNYVYEFCFYNVPQILIQKLIKQSLHGCDLIEDKLE